MVNLLVLAALVGAAAAESPATADSGFRGVYFNPLVDPEHPDFPWLLHYPQHRGQVRQALRELATEARVNLVDVIVCMPHTLAAPPRGPKAGERLESWASLDALDHLAEFVDDCHGAGLAVGFDLACNLWVPLHVDPEHQIGKTGVWPMPDDTPWDEAATWYVGVIEGVEARARHPEAIAFWGMMGNAELGGAEPCLWDREDNPAWSAAAERFVKEVWPRFRAAGKRPKAAPVLLPILADNEFWRARKPAARLSAFTNLHRWLVDDLHQPPDYWPFSTYPHCDPAPDGTYYLREINRILGAGAQGRILATDFKGPGHDDIRGSIVGHDGQPDTELLDWQFRKVREYGWAGWWIWAYQDTPTERSGLRDVNGLWKPPLLGAVRRQAAP